MADSENYEALARSARDQAAAATLTNVRERCLRSEAAWMAMAERSRRTERARAARVAAPVLTVDA